MNGNALKLFLFLKQCMKNLGMCKYQWGMQYNTPAKKTPQMKKYGGQICSNIILGVYQELSGINRV